MPETPEELTPPLETPVETDAPPTEPTPSAPTAVMFSVAGESLTLPPEQAAAVQRAMDRVNGTHGARLDALQRRLAEYEAQMATAPPPPYAPDDALTPPEMPDIALPDRDLLQTAPDVALRQLADSIKARDAARDAWTTQQIAHQRGEDEARALAVMREVERRDELAASQVMAAQQKQQGREQFFKKLYEEHPTLNTPGRQKVVQRVWQDWQAEERAASARGEHASAFYWNQDHARSELAAAATRELAEYGGGPAVNTPKTVSSGSRPASAPAAAPVQPKTLSDMIRARQTATRTWRPMPHTPPPPPRPAA